MSEEEQQKQERYVAASLVIVELFGQIQALATQHDDERLQTLADTAYKLLDEAIIKAFILQQAAKKEQPSTQLRTDLSAALERNLAELMKRQTGG